MKKKMMEDCIAAIATSVGEGGIAIVRVSGAGAIDKVDKIFEPKNAKNKLRNRPGYTFTLGSIMDVDKEQIDQVLAAVMRKPYSYTGEDTVEINCHGGIVPARRCLERVIEVGARIAEPGEFTKRAFLNGKLDASQAEAVVDVIRAKSKKGLKLAINQLEGKSKKYVEELEELIMRANMLVEASIDFPDEVGDLDIDENKQLIKAAIEGVEKMIMAAEIAAIYREGITVAICGKPNVGKSSLLNMLIGKEKAIVTEIPGTTRDIVEDFINIKGIPVKLIDTAGIRKTENLVEKIGVEKAQKVIKEADIILFMMDVGSGVTDEDLAIYMKIKNKEKVLVIVNKDDLLKRKIEAEDIDKMFPDIPVIRASVQEEKGMAEIAECIESIVIKGNIDADKLETMISIRQKELLEKAKGYLENAFSTIETVPLDCLGVDLGAALESLAEISGKNLKEDAINRIFHEFCIGK